MLLSFAFLRFGVASFYATASVLGQVQPPSASSLGVALHDALSKLNLTAAAALAVNASQYLLPKLSLPTPQTMLVPTNNAIEAANATLKGLNGSMIGTVLSYHIINGTLSYKTLPDMFDYHVIAMTQLNDSTLTSLPPGHSQALVFKRHEAKMGLEIVQADTSKDIFFNMTMDGPMLGPLLIQPINGLLTAPVNVTSTLGMIANLSTLAQTVTGQRLGPILDSIRGCTIFAPTNQAFTDAASVLMSANPEQVAAILSNHVLNGTVLYSPQMPRTIEENGSPAGDRKTNKTTVVTSAGGVSLYLAWNSTADNVQVTVASGGGKSNVTANIVRTDVLASNGVIHWIDKILLNDTANVVAATKVAGNDQAVVSIVKEEAPRLGTNSTAPSKKNAANTNLPTSATFVCIFSILALPAGIHLLY